MNSVNFCIALVAVWVSAGLASRPAQAQFPPGFPIPTLISITELSVDVAGGTGDMLALGPKNGAAAGEVHLVFGATSGIPETNTGTGKDGALTVSATLITGEYEYTQVASPGGITNDNKTDSLILTIDGDVTIRCQGSFAPSEVRALFKPGSPAPSVKIYAGNPPSSSGLGSIFSLYKLRIHFSPTKDDSDPNSREVRDANGDALPGGHVLLVTTFDGGILGGVNSSGGSGANGGIGGAGGIVRVENRGQKSVTLNIGARGGDGGMGVALFGASTPDVAATVLRMYDGGPGGDGGRAQLSGPISGSIFAAGGNGGDGVNGASSQPAGTNGGRGGNGGSAYYTTQDRPQCFPPIYVWGGSGGRGGDGGIGGNGGNGGAAGDSGTVVGADVCISTVGTLPPGVFFAGDEWPGGADGGDGGKGGDGAKAPISDPTFPPTRAGNGGHGGTGGSSSFDSLAGGKGGNGGSGGNAPAPSVGTGSNGQPALALPGGAGGDGGRGGATLADKGRPGKGGTGGNGGAPNGAHGQDGPEGLPDPNKSGIEHIVVLTMENRSFDHILGWLHDANGRQGGLSFPLPRGGTASTYHLTDRSDPSFPKLASADMKQFNPFTGSFDPPHTWAEMRVYHNSGLCNGWLLLDPPRDSSFPEKSKPGLLTSWPFNTFYTLGYYAKSDLPFLGEAATRHTVCDRFFAPLLAGTHPNKIFMLAADTPRWTNWESAAASLHPLTIETIIDRLKASGRRCHYYHDNLPFTSLWGLRYAAETFQANFFRNHIADSVLGYERGLPEVSFVDPSFDTGLSALSPPNDDHPNSDIRSGEAFMASIYNLIVKHAWTNTVFIITFDEAGGFFDHVRPPRALVAREMGLAARTERVPEPDLMGFRVPCLVISPWSTGISRRVAHGVYDFGSILKLIEWRWKLKPLTDRDRAANNLAEVFDFLKPDLTPPTTIEVKAPGLIDKVIPIIVDGVLSVFIYFDDVSILETAATPFGIWRTVPDAVSPYTVIPQQSGQAAQFYRVVPRSTSTP